jgi:hypothetical protein
MRPRGLVSILYGFWQKSLAYPCEIPARVAVISVASEPPSMAFKPSEAMLSFRFVYILAMPDPDYIDNDSFILDAADEAIVAQAVFPQPGQLAAQRRTETPGILAGGDPFAQVAHDAALGFTVDFFQIVFDLGIELNLPGQAASPFR